MTHIAFIGLGNMGGPMAMSLVKHDHQVVGFDLSTDASARLVAGGGKTAGSIAAAVDGAEMVITMLPAGSQVKDVYTGQGGVFAHAPAGALLIDCSTIDVATARSVAGAAAEKGFTMLDAPVSGGVTGAEAASLTFMVGGTAKAFAKAEPVLEIMGKTVVHAGDAGSGQAAKICNNMILGVSMIAVSEAFALADRLDLDRQKLFDISSQSSGQCWSMTAYCPVPGPVPASPANRDYQPGFTAAMMLKDLRLSQEAAKASGSLTPLGAHATEIYSDFCDAGNEGVDFSGIFKSIRQTAD
jgi:3-hydroxyisobutyrate dehydrogenase